MARTPSQPLTTTHSTPQSLTVSHLPTIALPHTPSQEEDGQFAAAVQLMIARTLSSKLGDARRQTGRRALPASRGRGGAESSGAEAQALLARTVRQQVR